MAGAMAARVAGIIEQAFDEDVKEVARAVLPKVAGGEALVQAEEGFRDILVKLKAIRERQLADVAEVFKC